jgi:hypothetical protein
MSGLEDANGFKKERVHSKFIHGLMLPSYWTRAINNSVPELMLSGGKGARITVTYAEALTRNGEKGNRNEISKK